MLLKSMTKNLTQDIAVWKRTAVWVVECVLVHRAFASNDRLVFFKWQVRVKH